MPTAAPSTRLPPGVTVLERGWLSSNNIVLVGARDVAVVDTGYCTHSDQTVELVARLAQERPVTTIASTHLHSDHCGGNRALQTAWPAARTMVPPGQFEAVRNWDEAVLSYEPTGQECPRFRVDEKLEPGSTVILAGQAWEVHAAPGHDPHSVILFHPETRTLLSADALWENGFGVVFPELDGNHAFGEVASTLDVIEGLAPELVIPGHGAVFSEVAGALERARSRLFAYQARPDRHAAHAAKVLVKFKLLELQRLSYADFFAWTDRTLYFRMVHERWFGTESFREWICGLLEDLYRSGAAAQEDGFLVNR